MMTPNWKTVGKIALPILIGSLILLLSAFYLRYLDLKRAFMEKISEKATSALGQRVQIEDLSFSPWGAIDLYGISIGNPQGFPPGQLLRIKRLHLDLRISELIKKRELSLQDLIVYSPEVTLIRDGRGRLNISDEIMRSFSQKKSKSAAKYQLDEFRIESGLVDFSGSSRYRTDQIDLRLQGLSSDTAARTGIKATFVYLGNRIKIDGWASLNESPKRVNISIASRDAALSAFQQFLQPYRMNAERTKVSVDFHAEGDMERGLDVKASLEGKIAGLFPWVKGASDLSLLAHATFSPDTDSLTLHSASLAVDGSFAAILRGTVGGLGSKPSYDAEIQIHRVDLSALQWSKDFQVKGILTSEHLRIAGNLAGKMPQIAGALRLREGGIESPDLVAQKIGADLFVSSGDEISLKGEASGRLIKVGRYASDKLKESGLRLLAHATFSPDTDSLTLHSASLAIDGSSAVALKGVVANLRQKPSYRAEVQIDRLNLDALNLGGNLRASGILSSRGLKVAGNLESKVLVLSGALRLREGGIESSDLVAQKIGADLFVSSDNEISLKGEASARVVKVGGYALGKPADARLSGTLQGNQQEWAVRSSLALPSLELKLEDSRSARLDDGHLTIDGTIRGKAFSGKTSISTQRIRYSDYTMPAVKCRFRVDSHKDGVTISDLALESKDRELSARQARITLPAAKIGYEIDIRGMNAAYPALESALKQCNLYLSLHRGQKSISGDLRLGAQDVTFYGIHGANVTASGRFDEKAFSLDIPRAEVLGGSFRLAASGRTAEGPFPIKAAMIAQGIDLGALPTSASRSIRLPYRVAAIIRRATFDGIINSPDSLSGQAFLDAEKVSLAHPNGGRAIVKDGLLRSEVEFQGSDLALRTEASVGKISTQISGTVKGFGGKAPQIQLKGALPIVGAADIRESFWDIFPEALLYAGLNGSLSSDFSFDYDKGGWGLMGHLLLKDLALEGENGEYSLGPINGEIPIRYGEKGAEAAPAKMPGFERSQFEPLRQHLAQEPSREDLYLITIGSLRYGFPVLKDIRLLASQKGSILQLERLSAQIFGGRLYGSAIIDASKGLNYRAGFLIKGLSLGSLCDSIQPIKGYIYGQVDGIASFKGSGAGLSSLMGMADFWTYRSPGEKTLVSKELLRQIGGPTLKAYLGNRPFNKGIMGLYLKNGYLIFKELEISNRNFFGVTDLSLKVAPLNNRISIEHLLWTITEAAERVKEKK